MDNNQVVEPHPERLVMDMGATKITPIGQLKPGVVNLYCQFIILEKLETRTVPNGHKVCTLRASDETGIINLTVWDKVADYLKPGDICSLKMGSTSVYRGMMALNCGKNSEMLKIGAFQFPASLTPDMSLYNAEYEKTYPNSKPGDGRKRSFDSGGFNSSRESV